MSTNENQSTQPYEEYGMDLERRLHWLEITAKENATKQVLFKGEELNIPRQIVSINLPKYRIKNGRTRSLQKEFLADNPEVRQDFFTRDDEVNDVQKAQHDLLLKLSHDEGMADLFSNTSNKQTEEIILDYNGFVVNGNRRLAFWRSLYKENREKYGYFANIRIVRLTPGSEADIAKLEKDLQTAPEIKSNYMWHSEAEMFRSEMESFSLNERDYAAMAGRKPAEIRTAINSLELAERYLELTGNANRFSKVDDQEEAFRRLSTSIRSTKMQDLGPTHQDLLREIVFCFIDVPGQGSTYKNINQLASNFVPVVKEVAKQLGVESSPEEQDEPGNVLAPQQSLSNEDSRNQNLINTINTYLREPYENHNSERVRTIVSEAIAKEETQSREQASATFLLDQCLKAHDILSNAVTKGLSTRTGTEGVTAHLTEMVALIEQIQQFLERQDA